MILYPQRCHNSRNTHSAFIKSLLNRCIVCKVRTSIILHEFISFFLSQTNMKCWSDGKISDDKYNNAKYHLNICHEWSEIMCWTIGTKAIFIFKWNPIKSINVDYCSTWTFTQIDIIASKQEKKNALKSSHYVCSIPRYKLLLVEYESLVTMTMWSKISARVF